MNVGMLEDDKDTQDLRSPWAIFILKQSIGDGCTSSTSCSHNHRFLHTWMRLSVCKRDALYK